MEFRDPGDREPTYAGTFATLQAAQADASKGTGGTYGAKSRMP
jgi:hypothetical protein